MYTMDLYWKMKFLLGKTILDICESRLDLLQSLNHLHKHMRDYNNSLERIDSKLEMIKHHLDIPRVIGRSLTYPTTPIPVASFDSGPLD